MSMIFCSVRSPMIHLGKSIFEIGKSAKTGPGRLRHNGHS